MFHLLFKHWQSVYYQTNSQAKLNILDPRDDSYHFQMRLFAISNQIVRVFRILPSFYVTFPCDVTSLTTLNVHINFVSNIPRSCYWISNICVFLRRNIGFVFAVNDFFSHFCHVDDKDSAGRDTKNQKRNYLPISLGLKLHSINNVISV